jgi:hypothetical protein
VDEATTSQLPRGLRLARLSIVPLAAILVAVLLLGRGEAVGKPVASKLGTTTQGREFRLGLDAKGLAAAFSTEIAAVCPNRNVISMPWDPTDGEDTRFHRHGDELRVQESGDGWKLALDGRSTGGGGIRGTLSLTVHITPEKGAPYDCASPHVRFFAGA